MCYSPHITKIFPISCKPKKPHVFNMFVTTTTITMWFFTTLPPIWTLFFPHIHDDADDIQHYRGETDGTIRIYGKFMTFIILYSPHSMALFHRWVSSLRNEQSLCTMFSTNHMSERWWWWMLVAHIAVIKAFRTITKTYMFVLKLDLSSRCVCTL